jgi:hypothetical protein
MLDSDSIFLGLIVIGVWWFISSIAVASAAGHRGRSVGAWFWASIFFGPILAALLLLSYPIEPVTKTDAIASLSQS